VPVALSVTAGTNNSVTAILYCQSCAPASGGGSSGVEVSFSGTVVGGAFHGSDSTNPNFTLDVAPIEAFATGQLLGLQVNTNSLGAIFYGIPLPLNSNPTDSGGVAFGDLAISSGPLPTCFACAPE
jgi:hypothetical protein